MGFSNNFRRLHLMVNNQANNFVINNVFKHDYIAVTLNGWWFTVHHSCNSLLVNAFVLPIYIHYKCSITYMPKKQTSRPPRRQRRERRWDNLLRLSTGSEFLKTSREQAKVALFYRPIDILFFDLIFLWPLTVFFCVARKVCFPPPFMQLLDSCEDAQKWNQLTCTL